MRHCGYDVIRMDLHHQSVIKAHAVFEHGGTIRRQAMLFASAAAGDARAGTVIAGIAPKRHSPRQIDVSGDLAKFGNRLGEAMAIRCRGLADHPANRPSANGMGVGGQHFVDPEKINKPHP